MNSTGNHTATYDAQDRLLDLDGQAFSYSLDGRLQDDGRRTYTYDVFGNLRASDGLVVDEPDVTYVVDDEGRRIRRSKNSVDTDFIWGDGLQLLKAGGDRFLYASSSGSPDVVQRGGLEYVVVRDHVGSIVGLIAPDGGLSEQVTYDAFGAVTSPRGG